MYFEKPNNLFRNKNIAKLKHQNDKNYWSDFTVNIKRI